MLTSFLKTLHSRLVNLGTSGLCHRWCFAAQYSLDFRCLIKYTFPKPPQPSFCIIQYSSLRSAKGLFSTASIMNHQYTANLSVWFISLCGKYKKLFWSLLHLFYNCLACNCIHVINLFVKYIIILIVYMP